MQNHASTHFSVKKFAKLTITEGNRFITDLDALISEYEDSIDFLNNWKELLMKAKNIKPREWEFYHSFLISHILFQLSLRSNPTNISVPLTPS